MQVGLLATDVAGLWLRELALFGLPASIGGVALAQVTHRWYLCPIVAFAAALAFSSSNYLTQHYHHTPSAVGILGIACALVFPPLLLATGLGYYAGRWIKRRAIARNRP